jgi:hypothetical protein
VRDAEECVLSVLHEVRDGGGCADGARADGRSARLIRPSSLSR